MMEGSRPHPTRLSHCTVILANNQCLRHKNVATPLVIQREGHRGRQRLDKKKYNRNDLTPPSDQLWKSRGYLMMFQSRPRHYKVLLPMSKHRFLFYSPLGYCLSRRWQALPPPTTLRPLHLIRSPPHTHSLPARGRGWGGGPGSPVGPTRLAQGPGAMRVTGVAARFSPFSLHTMSPSSLYHHSYLSYDRLKKDSEGNRASN